MAENIKPEIHLEVCSGFFRIPTETVNYNITVLDTGESSATKVVNQIVEVEKEEARVRTSPQKDSAPAVVPIPTAVPGSSVIVDEYYKEVALCFSGEFCRLAEAMDGDFSDTSEVSVTGEGTKFLKDAEKIVDEVSGSLNDLKELPELQNMDKYGSTNESEENTGLTDGLKDVSNGVVKAKKIISEILASVPETSSPVELPLLVDPVKNIRYLFDLDSVFQTMFELCTNETVKDHSQDARARAGEIFDTNGFLDYISPKVDSYDEDDGFLSVPITDILRGLSSVCSDKKVVSLLKNMDKKHSEIFLDKLLPLALPPTEEIEVEGEDARQAGGTSPMDQDESVEGVVSCLEEVKVLLSGIEDSVKEMTDLAIEPITANHHPAVSQEVYGAWQSKYKRIAQAMVYCLRQKEENLDLVFEDIPDIESLGDSYVVKEIGEDVEVETVDQESVVEELHEVVEQDVEAAEAESVLDEEEMTSEVAASSKEIDNNSYDDDFGEASQEDIDKLLEELGE